MISKFNIAKPLVSYDENTKEFSCDPTLDQAIVSTALATCFGSGTADKMVVSSCKKMLGVANSTIVDITVNIKGTLKTSKPRECKVRAKDNFRSALTEMLEDALVPQSVKDRIRQKFTAESARRNGFDFETQMQSVQPNTREIIEGMTASLDETETYAPSVSGTFGWSAKSNLADAPTPKAVGMETEQKDDHPSISKKRSLSKR